MNKQVILFMTCKQNFSDKLKKIIFDPLFNAIKDKYDLFICYNTDCNNISLNIDNVNVFYVHIDDLIRKYKKISYGFGPMLNSFFNNFYMLYEFYEKNPNYEYYWVIEDDVLFNGDWNKMFDTYVNNNDDLICSFYSTELQEDTHPLTEINGLLHKIYFTAKNFGIAFLPICRLSNRLINTTLNSKIKYNAFQEYQIGTIVNENKFSVTLFDNFNRNIKYDDNSSYNSISYRIPFTLYKELLTINDIIIHPIKKEHYKLLSSK